MTTPLNDADEERIIEAVATIFYGGVNYHTQRSARMLIGRMREQGITLTIEPEPEPVYPIRLTESQLTTLINGWHEVNRIHTWTPNERDLFHVLRNATPEER